MEKFTNRYEAGKVLATLLKDYTGRKDILVLSLPRGGVPVGYEVAKMLHAPLDVFIVRKLGVPGHEELAMGALATGGLTVFNEEVLQSLSIPQTDINRVVESEKKELKRREVSYRGNRPLPQLTDQNIILVDDGMATGATMRAAIEALRPLKPKSIVVAVPVSAPDTYEKIAHLVDKIICPLMPPHFYAVGQWYEEFNQTSDEEVYELLKKKRKD